MDHLTAPALRTDLPAPDRATTTNEPAGDDHRIAAVLVGLLVATIPLATGTAVWTAPGSDGDWTRAVTVAPFDLVLALIVAFAIRRPERLRALFRSRSVQLASGAYAAVAAVALAVHPSWLGLAFGLRVGAGLAVVATIAAATGAPSARTGLCAAITVVGALQAVLAMVQSARGEAFGIEYLDYAGILYPFGGSFAGRGGLTHPYHLAVLLIVAQGAALVGLRASCAGRADGAGGARWPWLVGLAVLGIGLATTYSRAALLGQLAVVAAAAVGRADRRLLVPAAAATLAGLLIGGVAFGDGWVAKSSHTASAEVDTGRRERISESLELTRSSPAVGVGPGRYVTALGERRPGAPLPAHNLVFHEGAELGVLGFAVALALLGLLGLRILRGGAWTLAVAAPVVPFLLLDAYPYVFATGLALSAVWLGLVRATLPDPAAASADALSPTP